MGAQGADLQRLDGYLQIINGTGGRGKMPDEIDRHIRKMNSVTSCWMNLKLGLPPRWAMLSTEPVTKLSMPMTLWPRARSKSVKCEPRKPAAPVTTEVG